MVDDETVEVFFGDGDTVRFGVDGVLQAVMRRVGEGRKRIEIVVPGITSSKSEEHQATDAIRLWDAIGHEITRKIEETGHRATKTMGIETDREAATGFKITTSIEVDVPRIKVDVSTPRDI